MKKLAACILAALIFVLQIGFPASAETYIPSRIINLVYDDSGSMIKNYDGEYVDTWCQAKYAMEVFAAMLGERDTLNIYYMSDYDAGTSAPPKVTLKGSKDASVTEQNVKTLHDLVTRSGNTPFNTLIKAYEDLKTQTADERWFVVLTDGAFDDNPETSKLKTGEFFDSCVAETDVKVMMLSMGADAPEIEADPDKNIFSEKAQNTTDILGKLTGICNRIFQSNALPVNSKNLTASFNVPMSQLIVFAQGKNVSIGAIESGKTKINPTSNVNVSYSTVATTHTGYQQDKIKIADDLMGYVAAYDADFKPGEYKLNVSGAEDIQVYYKPNVSIAAYLYEGKKEVTAEENLVAGKYRLEFGFVDADSGEKITDTSLLGKISYDAKIVNKTNSGDENTISAKSGDNISIKEGTLDIDVTASFLEYNTVNTKLSYQIYGRNDLIFSFEEKPSYTLTTEGFENPDDALVLTVKINDGSGEKALTADQWELLGIPEITTKDDLGEFKIEKSKETGKYLIYPTLKNNDPMETATGKIKVTVSGSFKQGLSAAKGEMEDSFKINTTITSLERMKDWLEKYWPQLAVSLALLILLLGYVPPFKKYLPRKIKKRPLIECSAEKLGMKDTVSHGKYKKSLASTLIPYKAETGSITFSPSPYKKTAKVRAAGQNGMYITNVREFMGKDEFTFNGMSIPEGKLKPHRISGGSTMSRRTPEYLYTCYLNR